MTKTKAKIELKLEGKGNEKRQGKAEVLPFLLQILLCRTFNTFCLSSSDKLVLVQKILTRFTHCVFRNLMLQVAFGQN